MGVVEREMKESGEKGVTEDIALARAGGQLGTLTDAQAQNAADWFVAESFGFGVEREMKTGGPSPISVGDLADWQSHYGTGGSAVLGQPVTFTATVSGSPIFGDRGDDFAMDDPGIADIDLSLTSAVDTGGIPVSLPEYGLFIA